MNIPRARGQLPGPSGGKIKVPRKVTKKESDIARKAAIKRQSCQHPKSKKI